MIGGFLCTKRSEPDQCNPCIPGGSPASGPQWAAGACPEIRAGGDVPYLYRGVYRHGAPSQGLV